MALDDGSLYAAVKVLVSVLETNSAMQQEMNRINGYKVCPCTYRVCKAIHIFSDFTVLICCLLPLVAAGFPAQVKELFNQLQNPSAGSVSLQFSGSELWF